MTDYSPRFDLIGQSCALQRSLLVFSPPKYRPLRIFFFTMARQNFGFHFSKCKFSLTNRCNLKRRKNISSGIKGLVNFQKASIHMFLLTTLCWFAVFRVVGFLRNCWHAVELKTILSAEQSFELSFAVDIRCLIFYGVLFYNRCVTAWWPSWNGVFVLFRFKVIPSYCIAHPYWARFSRH